MRIPFDSLVFHSMHHNATSSSISLFMLDMRKSGFRLIGFSPFASFSRVLQSICGMSVVKDWETLKKFNLAQLQEVKPDKKQEGGSEGVTTAASETTATPSVPVVEVPAEKS